MPFARFCHFAIAAFSITSTCLAASTIDIARSYSDGGGYKWNGSGVPETITFRGELILSKGESTYCSGFTFAVAMKTAHQRGLLKNKTADQLRVFQKQWYGATKDSEEIQCALAAEELGIGRQVDVEQAKPGDFLQLWRTNGSGHSVVFLGWINKDDRRIGLKYRSSQKSTNGIGDRQEYFPGIPGTDGNVDPKRLYFCRLNRSAAEYPLGD
jgi:hypothetical protein